MPALFKAQISPVLATNTSRGCVFCRPQSWAASMGAAGGAIPAHCPHSKLIHTIVVEQEHRSWVHERACIISPVLATNTSRSCVFCRPQSWAASMLIKMAR